MLFFLKVYKHSTQDISLSRRTLPTVESVLLQGDPMAETACIQPAMGLITL